MSAAPQIGMPVAPPVEYDEDEDTMGRSHKMLFESIAARSYLVDPAGTDADLMEMGKHHLATSLRHDHRMGRIAEHHLNMTGNRVVVERVDSVLAPPKKQDMMAGAVMSPSSKEPR